MLLEVRGRLLPRNAPIPRRARLAMRALAASVLMLVVACDRGAPDQDGTPAQDENAPKPMELPPLVLRDDTADLLLTWVDDQGDFHVVQKIGDVPEKNRNPVRVVVATKREGTGELVYVADLSKKGEGGSYAVKTMTRAAWEEVGASKRTARLEALAPSKVPPPAASGAAAVTGISAVVYGADWCKPCHDAEHLLKQLGVQVTKKDIEKSASAQREMGEALKRVHRSGASIPVIDVMGTVLVGFSPSALRRAVDGARQRQTL